MLGSSVRDLQGVAASFHPHSERKQKALLSAVASEAGASTQTVRDYYLHRFEVTNEQYLVFVKVTGHRFPFHWWKFGEAEHYRESRAKWVQEFSGQDLQHLLYWERHYATLPYSIPKGEERHPVVFVSWEDAQAFCAWAGVRLPTEAEWVRAARGEDSKQYLLGEQWDKSWLADLRLQRSRERSTKPVGAVGAPARGLHAHEDLIGNVWEWTGDVGYYPVSGIEAFQREVNKGRAHGLLPPMQPEARLVKGGSFLSWGDPVQFRIDTRGHQSWQETLEGVGFRIAKDVEPGRSMCRSELSRSRNLLLAAGSEPEFAGQVGAERYDVEGDVIRGYASVSLVPMRDLGLPRNTSIAKLREQSRARPIPAAILISTEALDSPRLPAGTYTVCYRDAGVAKELRDALRSGRRALAAKREVPGAVAAVLRASGLAPEDAARFTDRSLETIRVGDLDVAVREEQFLFRDHEGNYVGACPAPKSPVQGSGGVSSVEMGGGPQELEFHFASAVTEGRRKVTKFRMHVRVSTAVTNWRKSRSAR